MAILGFTGKLPVALGIVWKGDAVSNLIDDRSKRNRYLIANPSLTELRVTGIFGGTTLFLERKATPKNRLYDDSTNLFIMEPATSVSVEKFLALKKTDPVFLQFTFTFNTFFDKMAEQMTRNDADLHSLANPNDSKSILDTFKTSGSGEKIVVTYQAKTQTAKAIKANIIDTEVKAAPKGGKFPAVKIMLEIDFGTAPKDPEKELMRKLVAMDWSKLARFGSEKSKRNDVQIWKSNVLLYLLNHTDMARGEQFRQAIVDRHKGKSAKSLTKDLRDDLDLHLITANHWGQKREDLKTETHQRLLSDLFGTLHSKAWLSSPVHMLRFLNENFLNDDFDKVAALALQYGVGHCGEHAKTSFSVLRSIGGNVTSVIFTGNANVDHAFVIYNLKLDETFKTRSTNPKNQRTGGVGIELEVWNLRDALSKNPKGVGLVMDPYLDKSETSSTPEGLLVNLNNAKRKKQGRDTDFLSFRVIHPPPDPPQTDLRGNSDSDLKKLVPNV